MKCKYCNYEMDRDAVFCPSCGKKVEIESTEDVYCVSCGNKFGDTDTFCHYCGTSRKMSLASKMEMQKPTSMQTEKSEYESVNEQPIQLENRQRRNYTNPIRDKQNYFKNPIIWIISIATLALSLVLGLYVQETYTQKDVVQIKQKDNDKKSTKDKKGNADITDFAITKETTIFMQQYNINTGGNTYSYQDKLYVATENGVIVYNSALEEQETILEEDVSYLHVDDMYLYYADVNMTYCRMNLTTKEVEELLDIVYYPQIVDSILYYQNEDDGESLHSYDLNTKEDKKLNDVSTYDTYIDKEKNSIYYSSYIDGKQNISRMDLDGQNNELLISDDVMNFTYDGKNISYQLEGIVYTYDVVSKEKKEVVTYDGGYDTYYRSDGTFYVNSTLGYMDSEGMHVLEDTGESQLLLQNTDESLISMQVVGEYIVCWLDEEETCGIYLLDVTGNYAYLVEGYSYDYEDYDEDYYDEDYYDEDYYDEDYYDDNNEMFEF